MPNIEINKASIYYQTYGDDQPNRVPIVLIHGSTVDSHTDWDSIAPELARRYKVFALDCRGDEKCSTEQTRVQPDSEQRLVKRK